MLIDVKGKNIIKNSVTNSVRTEELDISYLSKNKIYAMNKTCYIYFMGQSNFFCQPIILLSCEIFYYLLITVDTLGLGPSGRVRSRKV